MSFHALVYLALGIGILAFIAYLACQYGDPPGPRRMIR